MAASVTHLGSCQEQSVITRAICAAASQLISLQSLGLVGAKVILILIRVNEEKNISICSTKSPKFPF